MFLAIVTMEILPQRWNWSWKFRGSYVHTGIPVIFVYSYGHLLVITGYFNGIIQSINGVLFVLITGKGP